MAVVQFHPAASFPPFAECGVFSITLDVSADVDLTDPAGPTGGYCARFIQIGDTAGNVKFKDMLGNDCTIPVVAGQILKPGAQYIYSSGHGTTAATITAQG